MRANKIKRSDYARVLVTETIPYETPVIFSNDGLYQQVKSLDLENGSSVQETLLGALIITPSSKATIPYLYKIRKNSLELRRLALPHPSAQWKFKEFYERYESLILYHSKHSPASIRAPRKVASTFYLKSSVENVNRYKAGNISLLKLDNLTKHSPSYFAYRGYDRLYRFYESKDYFELEKRYAHMRTLDVSKCFDSIYTHTLSWAVKDKAFTKANVNVSTFAHRFDQVMGYANHSETNGIIIGPEVSRIFAEIIFQEIDVRTIQRLNETHSLQFEKQYAFRRYVDDVLIFGVTPEITTKVYQCYADILMTFNLHANASKSLALERPFITNKSRLTQEAKLAANAFLEKFLDDSPSSLIPKKIHSRWGLTRSLIEAVKTLCSRNQVNYDEVAGFLISVLTERVKKLVAVDEDISCQETAQLYLDALVVLLEAQFFLYQVSPSVSASYKLSTTVILSIRFARKRIPKNAKTISQRIFELTLCLLHEEKTGDAPVAEGYLALEVLNIVLAVRELGDDHLLPGVALNRLFSSAGNSYFGIVSCLFYIRDEPQYAQLRKEVLKNADLKLADLCDVRWNSEKAFLLLDLLSCPYIAEKKRAAWLRRAFKQGLGRAGPAAADVAAFFSAAQGSPLHINWTDFDLLNSLEKKELKRVY